MGRVSDNKIWAMDWHTFDYWQHSSWQRQGSGNKGPLLQIEKAPEASNGDITCYVFSLEETMVHLIVTNPSWILTIEK